MFLMRMFFWAISARFFAVRSACEEGVGLFDALFSASKLRRALTLVLIPLWVLLDGLPHSLQTKFPLVAAQSLHFLQPRFLM